MRGAFVEQYGRGAAWIGRDDEVAALRQLEAGVAAGHDRRLLIEGEPGVGKTALLGRLLVETEQSGFLVLSGAADELSRRHPLHALVDCLETDTRRGGQAHRIRSLALLRAGGDTAAGIGELVTLLTELCAKGPVVLALDNFQWADDASLAVWRRLSSAAHGLPLLLAAAGRPTPDRLGGELPWTRKVLIDHDAVAMAVAPLTDSQSADLARSVLGAPPGPRLLERLRGAAGNPRYLHDLLAELRRDGLVDAGDGIIELAREERRESGTVTPAADGPALSVADRLGYLTPAALRTLRGAAALGDGFTPADLAALLRTDPGSLRPVIDEVITAGLVAPADTTGPAEPGDAREPLHFRHAMIQEALYTGIPESLRPAMHLEAARALAEVTAPALRVAGHLRLAGTSLDEWAAGWLAGHAGALVEDDPALTVELTRRALEHVRPGRPEHKPLEEALVAAISLLHRPDSADRIRALRDRTVASERRTELSFLHVVALIQEGRVAEALTATELAMDEAGGRTVAAARLHGVRAHLLWLHRRFDEAQDALDAILGPDREGPYCPIAEGYARYTQAYMLLRSRDYAGAYEEVRLGLAAAGRRRVAADITLSLNLLGAYLLSVLERPAEAREWIDSARSRAEDAGHDAHAPAIAAVSAGVGLRLGDWDRALQDIDAVGELPGDPWLPIALHGIAAIILIGQNRTDEARAHLAVVAEVPIEVEIPSSATDMLLIARSQLAEREGRVREALDILLPTLEPNIAVNLRPRHHWLPDMVRMALESGDDALARAVTDSARDEAALNPDIALHRAAALRCRGLLDRDPEPLREALAYEATAQLPPTHGHTLEDLAAVLAQNGDHESARSHLGRAVEVYESFGADWFTVRADARLRALGVRRGRRSSRRLHTTGWEALTPTERKVALLVAEGRSNPDVANELLMSPRTVQTHVSHILAKLEVRSRIEIAREVLPKRSTTP
ncbi:AAA family ATPase [Streptomyces sp. NPDC048629]|uniref:helix-turn-helix transcriptional regulator n=1 Tax=Streptomyces sp. NPDC048629 TaxID=3154824 RepID=UPI00343F9721